MNFQFKGAYHKEIHESSVENSSGVDAVRVQHGVDPCDCGRVARRKKDRTGKWHDTDKYCSNCDGEEKNTQSVAHFTTTYNIPTSVPMSEEDANLLIGQKNVTMTEETVYESNCGNNRTKTEDTQAESMVINHINHLRKINMEDKSKTIEAGNMLEKSEKKVAEQDNEISKLKKRKCGS